MAAHFHLVLLGHRHHALEEVGDPLPVGVGVHRARDGRRVLVLVLGEHELAVLDGPRPLTVPERGMPRMVKLYFVWNTPTFAMLRICWHTSSILRSRSGFLPRKMAGISARSIDAESS